MSVSIIQTVVALIWFVLTIRIAGAQPIRSSLGERAFSGLLFAVLTAIGVVLASENLHTAIAGGYPGDSLYELTNPQIAIVILVSIVAGLAASTIAVMLAKRLSGAQTLPGSVTGLITNLGLVALIFWIGYALSPQIFYAYYRTIFDGLPLHYVGRSFSDLTPFWEALTVIEGGHLNDHGAALILWMMIVITLAIHIGRFANAHVYGRAKLVFVVAASAAIIVAIP